MKDKCEHMYTYTFKKLFLQKSVFSKKKCEKCNEIIQMSKGSKALLIMYALALIGILILVSNKFDVILTQATYEEKIGIIFAFFSTAYVLGLYYILKKVKYVTYKGEKKTLKK